MKFAKLMKGLRLSMASLMIGALYAPYALSQELSFLHCKGLCQAKKAINNLQNYNLDLKKKLSDPLGSEVCVQQLKGNVAKINKVDVCLFQDKSAIKLPSLHIYSERFAKPVP